ncbi:ATPase AAA [Methyloterricola oryzae]|uniref:ATPase AAA n=1 Tax=Methyloterricola oryzae TaxID=1495050 RepID=UPI0005EB3D9B|nr:ATPase AAA [Methyloterricola oryzae]
MNAVANLPTGESARGLAPRPRSVEETGLGRDFLCDLLAKHLYWGGVLDQQQLVQRLALAWPVLETLLQFMRGNGVIEVRSPREGSGLLRYALTERGRNQALDALLKSGYSGRAPVPLPLYQRVVEAQSVHRQRVGRADIVRVFNGMVIRPSVLEQLGPAMHSGRPIFVYGPPGTGKTYISLHLARLLAGTVLIPQSLAVGDYVVQFFDPSLHHPVADKADPAQLLLDASHDQRFLECQRPVVVTGGELTLDMLELSHDPMTKQYFAPLQLKANNGIYMVDDLGRQRVDSKDLLNRWIVPLEQKLDYLTVGSGTRFPVPFDVVLIFSTNLNPLELADEAFLRRLGYKVRFDTLTVEEFGAIWRQVCDSQGIEFDSAALSHVLSLYLRERRPLLPCQPRDLIGLALDQCRYEGLPNQVTAERTERAWNSYFVRPAWNSTTGSA